MKPAAIVLVKFPFSNLNATKQRPALVLSKTSVSRKEALVTLAMITSKIEGLDLDGDIRLTRWKEAGLIHPSLVRLAKIATLESSLIIKQLGELQLPDLRLVNKEFSKTFDFWITTRKS